jgi:hypothetical protein
VSPLNHARWSDSMKTWTNEAIMTTEKTS